MGGASTSVRDALAPGLSSAYCKGLFLHKLKIEALRERKRRGAEGRMRIGT